MKKILIAVGIILVIQAVVVFIIGRVFYPDNVAETSANGGVKQLHTRAYRTDVKTAKQAVKEIVPTLTTYGGNWNIVSEKDDEDSAAIIAEIPVLMFTDDLEIIIERVGLNGGVEVNAVSKSRVGQSDFGENARHVRQILNALDEKLGNR